jgi:hypothetical protein
MRALLTETERAVLARTNDPSENYVTTVRSRLRERLEELEADVAVLADQEPELLADLREAVDDPRVTPEQE